jgi:DNA/RNA-binding domain of Phe-tRNA-synthetase-like protein
MAMDPAADPLIAVEPHPMLDVGTFVSTFPHALDHSPSPSWLTEMLSAQAPAPFQSDDTVRAAVRDLLRHGGFKPTGRSKPASEYLLRAAAEGALGAINTAVDACNAVSLHSGLPISVIDLDLAAVPLRIGIAPEGSSYAFNASGQVIEVRGLLCLFDAQGPCANAVKDAQRTKTRGETRQTLSIVWGARVLGDRTQRVTEWYRSLIERAGATTRS